jgi:hypothetical protein
MTSYLKPPEWRDKRDPEVVHEAMNEDTSFHSREIAQIPVLMRILSVSPTVSSSYTEVYFS